MSKAKIRNTLIAVTIYSVLLSNVPKADASAGEAANFIQSNWGAIVSNFWSPYWKQVWYSDLSPQETRSTRQQYQSRADGVLLNRCIDKFSNNILQSRGNKVLNRWQFSSRSASNGGTHCFIRLPNRWADEFDMRMRR